MDVEVLPTRTTEVTTMVYASSDESVSPPAGDTCSVIRVRRLPLRDSGIVAHDQLVEAVTTGSSECDVPGSSSPPSHGPLVVPRANTEEPMVLSLGRETFEAVPDGSTAESGSPAPSCEYSLLLTPYQLLLATMDA